METQHVIQAVRALEARKSVTVEDVAGVLETPVATVQPLLDALVTTGALGSSVMQCRPHAGTDFTVRRVWYHTPEREVTARFGAIFDPCGANFRETHPGAPAPVLSTA